MRTDLAAGARFGSQATARVVWRLWAGLLCLLFSPAAVRDGWAATNPPAPSVPAFSYFHDVVRSVPLSIHVAKVAHTNPAYELHTTLGSGPTLGMSLVSEQVRTLPPECGRPVAAINGDFFRSGRGYVGDPEGLQIACGELVSGPAPRRICVWVDAQGQPHRNSVTAQFKVTWPDKTVTPFGLNEEREPDAAVLYTAVMGPATSTAGGQELVLERAGQGAWLPLRVGQTYTARVREVRAAGNTPLGRDVAVLSIGPKLLPQTPKAWVGALLQISTATTPDLAGSKTGLGGGPTLVRGGKAASFDSLQPRHPRSAIGWNKDYFFLVVVDGRQLSLSLGMTLPELAAYMVKLGCQEAINLDGGGSATLWVEGKVVNSPSNGNERAAANALVVTRKDKPPK